MLIIILSLTGLMVVFIFQRLDLAAVLNFTEVKVYRFMINRTIRFLLNDLFLIALIYGIFLERKYVVFAFWTQIAGIVLVLIPYFVLKLYYPGYNGPLVSFLHRLVVNPVLLLLLIPAFYYQERTSPRT